MNDEKQHRAWCPITWVVIVIGILGGLLAIAIPSFVSWRRDVTQQECKDNVTRHICRNQNGSARRRRENEAKSAGHVMVLRSDTYVVGSPEQNTGYWEPEEADVSAMESAINSLFANPDKRLNVFLEEEPTTASYPLSDYFIRYGGVVRKGKKLIIGKGVHKLLCKSKRVLEPSSGLDYYGCGAFVFTVIYNVTDKGLVEFKYNAPL